MLVQCRAGATVEERGEYYCAILIVLVRTLVAVVWISARGPMGGRKGIH